MATQDTSRLNVNLGPQLDSHHILHDGSLPSGRKASNSSVISNNASMKSQKESMSRRQKAYSSSSRNTEASSNGRTETRASNKLPRTLPPWIDSYEEPDDRAHSKATDRLLPPSPAHSAQHHHTPTTPTRRISQDGFVDDYEDTSGVQARRPEMGFFGGKRQPVRGRKWDHARDGEPVIMQSNKPLDIGPQWRTYIKSSQYGPGLSEDAEQVDEAFLRDQTPGYSRPWRGDLEDEEDPEKTGNIFRNKKKQKTLIKRLQRNLLVSPYVPGVLRLITLVTSLLALSLSGSIYHLSDSYSYDQTPSTTMAVIVDVVAIPYISYITYDEYRGKPLGLRPARTKIRLVLLDLFFIIFESANLALAFGSLTDDNGACRYGPDNGPNDNLCDRVRTLCAILFIALLAWSLTFAISIFRLVERIGGREDAD